MVDGWTRATAPHASNFVALAYGVTLFCFFIHHPTWISFLKLCLSFSSSVLESLLGTSLFSNNFLGYLFIYLFQLSQRYDFVRDSHGISFFSYLFLSSSESFSPCILSSPKSRATPRSVPPTTSNETHLKYMQSDFYLLSICIQCSLYLFKTTAVLGVAIYFCVGQSWIQKWGKMVNINLLRPKKWLHF